MYRQIEISATPEYFRPLCLCACDRIAYCEISPNVFIDDFLIDKRPAVSLDSNRSLRKKFVGGGGSKGGWDISCPCKTLRAFLFADLKTPWLQTGSLHSSSGSTNLELRKRDSPSKNCCRKSAV